MASLMGKSEYHCFSANNQCFHVTNTVSRVKPCLSLDIKDWVEKQCLPLINTVCFSGQTWQSSDCRVLVEKHCLSRYKHCFSSETLSFKRHALRRSVGVDTQCACLFLYERWRLNYSSDSVTVNTALTNTIS